MAADPTLESVYSASTLKSISRSKRPIVSLVATILARALEVAEEGGDHLLILDSKDISPTSHIASYFLPADASWLGYLSWGVLGSPIIWKDPRDKEYFEKTLGDLGYKITIEQSKLYIRWD